MSGRDADEFDAFYAARAATLVRLLYLRTGDLTRAQDCVQEAFTRAWLRWPALSSGPDPVAWVRTVAWRLAVSDWRRSRRERVRDEHLRALATSESSLPALAPEVVAVREALRQLPGHQQTAVVLHYFEDLSIAEISAMTGAPAGTVKSSLHRARSALRVLLADDSPQGDGVAGTEPTRRGGRE